MSYMVNSTARFDVYVSNVAANDIPVGNDTTGTGGRTAPYLTLAKAMLAVPIGGRILLNGTASSPAVYNDGPTFTRSTRIEAVSPLGAILAGSGTDQAITISPAVIDQTFTFRDLIIDPSENSGGPAARCVTLVSNFPRAPNVTFDGVKLQNWTAYAMASDVSVRIGTLTMIDTVMTGAAVSGGIYLGAIETGHLVVSGGSCTITDLATGSTGSSIHWAAANAAASNITASIIDFSQTITLAAAAPADLYYGIRLNNILAALVDGGTHQILGAPVSGATASVITMETSAIAQPIHGSIVRNVATKNTANGGYCVKMGEEAVGSYIPAEGVIIEDSTAEGDVVSAAGSMHGFFLGVTSNSTIRRTTSTNVGLIGIKESTNGALTDNIINGYGADGLVMKGVTGGTVSGNEVTQTGSYANGQALFIEENPDSGTPSTDINVTDNVFTMAGGTGTLFVKLDNASTATPTNNVYNLNSGTLNANPWQWGASNYATLSAWKSAVEPSASGNAP